MSQSYDYGHLFGFNNRQNVGGDTKVEVNEDTQMDVSCSPGISNDVTKTKRSYEEKLPHGEDSTKIVGNIEDIAYAACNDIQKLSRLVVLVVDDSVVQRKLTRSRLSGKTENGADIDQVMVNTAENGERALAYCNETTVLPDVVLIDEYMNSTGGTLSGHEVVQFIRNNAKLSHILIIGCTARPEAKDVLLQAGCDDVWIKPIPCKEEALRQILILRDLKYMQLGNNIQSNHKIKEVTEVLTGSNLKQFEDQALFRFSNNSSSSGLPQDYTYTGVLDEWSHVRKKKYNLVVPDGENDGFNLEGVEVILDVDDIKSVSSLSTHY